jgi:glycosyltransferase involved in cell wall biosynthesis
MALLLDCRPLSWTSREDMHIAVCRALRERGVQPVIVFSGISGAFRRTYEDAGVIVEEVNYKHGAVQYFRRMRTIFRQYHVDTVDIEFFSYFDPIAWMARLNGVKNIVFTESNSGVLRARSWKAALVRLRAAVVTAPVRRFVAISDFVRQQMLLLGLEDARISVVHKGIDLRRYLPDSEARGRLMDRYGRPDEIILGTVMVMRQFKHPEVILEACALLRKGNVPFRLFVAGGGELGPQMEALAVRLGIADRVHWLGYVDRPEDFMRGWDVFLLASEGEAFGFVLVEAMCCGVPVVASASGAIPEIVEHERTGFVTPVLDSGAMAEAIRTLAQDESRRREMAAACGIRVRDRFSVDAAAEKTLAVYESMWRDEAPAMRQAPASG